MAPSLVGLRERSSAAWWARTEGNGTKKSPYTARHVRSLFERLEAKQPIVLGVFGASVAQNGGCLDQPYKRCMRYDGVHRTYMKWGEPKIRPFKGFAVRFLERINAEAGAKAPWPVYRQANIYSFFCYVKTFF